MAPDERRAALIEATVPLLRQHGTAVSTRQIAEAAGVAEGTIFRVFPDKSSLLRAAVLSTFEPESTLKLLDGIDPDLPLRDRLKAMATVLQHRIGDMTLLIGMLRTTAGTGDPREFMRPIIQSSEQIRQALAERLRGDEQRLRRSPALVAFLLSGMLAAGMRGPHTLATAEELAISSDEIVDVLLDGLLRDPDEPVPDNRGPDKRGPDKRDPGGRHAGGRVPGKRVLDERDPDKRDPGGRHAGGRVPDECGTPNGTSHHPGSTDEENRRKADDPQGDSGRC